MRKASISVALLAAFFAYASVGEVEAAPAADPVVGILGLGASVTNTIREIADIITKLVTGKFDFSDSAGGALKLISDAFSKSFVSINNSNNENNNDEDNTDAPTIKTTSNTEDLYE